MTERQELYCHGCDRYVQFNIDTELEGNHAVTCPNCGHEHYRVVKGGVVTDERWASSGPVYPATGYTFTIASIDTTSTASSSFLTASWSTMTTYSLEIS